MRAGGACTHGSVSGGDVGHDDRGSGIENGRGRVNDGDRRSGRGDRVSEGGGDRVTRSGGAFGRASRSGSGGSHGRDRVSDGGIGAGLGRGYDPYVCLVVARDCCRGLDDRVSGSDSIGVEGLVGVGIGELTVRSIVGLAVRGTGRVKAG